MKIMIKEICGLKLKGANFSESKELVLFGDNKKYIKATLLYGRNGAGKSTIAKAVRLITGNADYKDISANFYNRDNEKVTLSGTDNIFVFDEKFVEENVRIEGDLESIAILGKQVDLTQEIEEVKKKLDEARKLVESRDREFQEYTDKKNPKAPQFYRDSMREILRGDGGWAGRDRKIKNNKTNTPVKDDTYKKIIEHKPEKQQEELWADFKSNMEKLKIARDGGNKIVEEIPSVPEAYGQDTVAYANKLIKEKIEKPGLSDREKLLLDLVTGGKSVELQERERYLSNENNTFCPYCLQDLTVDYKEKLVRQIQKVLTDKVKSHQVRLKELKYNKLEFDLSFFSALNSYQQCDELLKKINDIIDTNNEIIQKKIDNPYVPLNDKDISNVARLIKKLNTKLDNLKKEKDIHNTKVGDIEGYKNTLTDINEKLAYYEIIENCERLKLQKIEYDKAKKCLDEAKSYKDEQEEVLKELNEKRKNFKIAIDVINRALKYIFFTENRLAIKSDGDSYKVLSNGEMVPPQQISVGERNILGLCYFFAKIMEERDENSVYGDENLLIIDDPISSYDFENKIGILSFLKLQLARILNGNINSRAIVMTHDLMTLYELQKIFEELSNDWKKNLQGIKTSYCILELKDCALSEFRIRSRQEYTELLKQVYYYGNNESSDYDIVIGNVMRQALEAFATFEYGYRIDEVSTDDKILSQIPPEYTDHFKNLMYRLVLHGGSHREEQVKSLNIDFYSLISSEEKRRTAKEIICFMYLLNKAHVLARLKEINNVEVIIETWIKDLEKSVVVM